MLPIYNASLRLYNTFGLEARAQVLVEARQVSELQQILDNPVWKGLPLLVLGGGSNVLFTKNFDGLVILNRIAGIEKVSEDADYVRLKVGAGEVWHDLVMYCVANDYKGIENLSLIPGTVGAAPMQNIGAYGVEVKEVIESVEALHIETNTVRHFSNEECEFGYRESIFKGELKNQYIITGINIRLHKKAHFNLDYGDIRNILGDKDVNVKSVSDAVIQIRQSKLPDPKDIGNAGSFFKNPEIPEAEYLVLKEKFNDLPGYVTPNGIKVPAGWLIERAGWKGFREGDIGVHSRQALVLVNYGEGTGEELIGLARRIQASVAEKYGITISPEVNFC